MSRFRFTYLVGLVSLAAVGLAFVAKSRAARCMHIQPDQWHPGDILFMDGISLRSRAVRFIEGYSTDYSHVGVIVMESGVPFVIHADPTLGHVVKERWDVVLSPNQILGGAVYRLRNAQPKVIGTVVTEVNQFARDHVPFNSHFDQNATNRLYCTQLVWRAYDDAGVDLRLPEDSRCSYILPAYLLNPAKLEKVASF